MGRLLPNANLLTLDRRRLLLCVSYWSPSARPPLPPTIINYGSHDDGDDDDLVVEEEEFTSLD